MTISLYQLKNIILAEHYTKSRKLMILNDLMNHEDINQDTYNSVKAEILEEESEDTVMDNFEVEDRYHWIQYYANRTAADLLTLGKVQPETMLEMSLLPTDDFEEVVKYATIKANKLNTSTMEVERQINLNSVPSELL
jgi:hypothetical protein